MGNLQDHWMFVLVLVIAFIGSMSLATNWTLGHGMTRWYQTGILTNQVVLFLFNLIFCGAGLIGVAGTIGLWRFLDWGRMFTMIGMLGVAGEGLMTLIGGGSAGSRLAGAEVATVVLEGLIKMALAGLVVAYLYSHDISSRTRPPQG